MPGVPGAVHLGARRHMRFVVETDFGQCPGAPDWASIPILEDGMKLKATSPRYRPDTDYGGDFRRHVHVCHQLVVEGDIVTHPWPEVAEFLLHMALDRDADHDLTSYCIDHYTPADPRRYLGAVVERLTIAATGTGNADVRFTLGMVAKLEEEHNALVEGDFDFSGLTMVPFMFRDAALRLAGGLVIDIDDFTLTVENNVARGPNVATAGTDQGTVAYVFGQQRAISLELGKLNRDDRFNELIRDCGSISFEANFAHPDGHLLQIQLPVIYPEESDEDGTPSQVAKERPRFEAGCDVDGKDILWGVDLAAGGTTTLPPFTSTSTTSTSTSTTTGA